MNADGCYVDPSALRRLYVHDARSRAFSAWRGRLTGALTTTLHGRAELVNSIMLTVFRGELELEQAHAALEDLDDDYAQGRLLLVDLLWRRTLDRAAELSREHTASLGTRTLDVLHVASALTLGCRRFITYDERQAKLARAVKLKVLDP
jgi:predicted nucleic acid-binding protein